MKILIAIAVLLLGLLGLFLYASSRSEHRAKFISLMNDLKEADYELRNWGSFTNQFRYSTVYSCTNRYVVDGRNYQCEFRGEREEFSGRGFLAITTNQIFIWVDRTRGVIPLLPRDSHLRFPPGI